MTSEADRSWEHARAVADAVLYEGYLLYPYRATSQKNQSRWQFGVLGPPGAEAAGLGEDDRMSAEIPIRPGPHPAVTVVVRFLQLQHRGVEQAAGTGFEPVDELIAGPQSWRSWDEAVECELTFGPFGLDELDTGRTDAFAVPSGTDIADVDGGRLVRTRSEVHGELTLHSETDGDMLRLTMVVRNTGAAAPDKDQAIARSLIGTHMIAHLDDAEFVSLLDPPPQAQSAVTRCAHHRAFPVLAGAPGTHNLMLVSPIILYDHPEIAEQSKGALYDSTEIDEILTLRIMTMTDEEKAQARATDPRAAEIIDRCEAMSAEALLNLHGVLRDPHAAPQHDPAPLIPEVPAGVDWWDPMADGAVDPEIDAVLIDGIRIGKGSRVLLRPSRRADAQDLFYADRVARVTSVHETVDGQRHLGVVLEDDPAAELHDWYGRYLYFAPDEVEPMSEGSPMWK